MRSLLVTSAALLLLAAASGSAQQEISCPSVLSRLSSVTYFQNQSFSGSLSPHNWMFNPCAGGSAPACSGQTGYLQEFYTYSGKPLCEKSFDAVNSPWTFDGNNNNWRAEFGDSQGNTASVYLNCYNSPKLTPIGDAKATSTASGTFHWVIVLGASAICGNTAAPSLAPTLPPHSPQPTLPPGSCPITPSLSHNWQQDQEFRGELTTHDWFLSPCSRSTNGIVACNGTNPAKGYFQEYYKYAGQLLCERSFDTVIQWWTPTASGTAYTAVFGNSLSLNDFANIKLKCSSSGHFHPQRYVQAVSNLRGGFNWTVEIETPQACGSPPATSLAPSSPGYGSCSQYKTCQSCTTSASGTCGYCAYSKQCVEGSATGPTKGTCPSSYWEWYVSQCSKE